MNAVPGRFPECFMKVQPLTQISQSCLICRSFASTKQTDTPGLFLRASILDGSPTEPTPYKGRKGNREDLHSWSGNRTAFPVCELRVTASVNSMYFTPSSNEVRVIFSLPRIALMNSSSTRQPPCSSRGIGIS